MLGGDETRAKTRALRWRAVVGIDGTAADATQTLAFALDRRKDENSLSSDNERRNTSAAIEYRAALANGVMLAVTYWFHVTHPYGTALLTPEGIAALPGQASLFTADGLRNLGADGGATFLHMVQFKAEGLSAIWTVAALLLAAWGAGPLSIDRTILKREF